MDPGRGLCIWALPAPDRPSLSLSGWVAGGPHGDATHPAQSLSQSSTGGFVHRLIGNRTPSQRSVWFTTSAQVIPTPSSHPYLVSYYFIRILLRLNMVFCLLIIPL